MLKVSAGLLIASNVLRRAASPSSFTSAFAVDRTSIGSHVVRRNSRASHLVRLQIPAFRIETVSGPSRRALQPGRGCASHCAPRGTFAKEAAATLLPMPQISGADMSFELRSTETQTRQKCRKPRRSLHTPVYEPL